MYELDVESSIFEKSIRMIRPCCLKMLYSFYMINKCLFDMYFMEVCMHGKGWHSRASRMI